MVFQYPVDQWLPRPQWVLLDWVTWGHLWLETYWGMDILSLLLMSSQSLSRSFRIQEHRYKYLFFKQCAKTKSTLSFPHLYSSVNEAVQIIALACPPRSWIALLKWLIKLTASSPCYRPAPTSLRFTQDPMAYLSKSFYFKLSMVFNSILTEF